MTKRSPCQFGLAPRGDLPTAFEVGSRAPPDHRGQGAGVAQTLPPPPPPGQEFSRDRTPCGQDHGDSSVPRPAVGTGARAPAHAAHGTHTLCTRVPRPEHPPRGTVPRRTALYPHTMRVHTPHLAHTPHVHTRHTLRRPQHAAPCTHTLSTQRPPRTLAGTVCTASPMDTLYLGRLAHARRAHSTSRALSTTYGHTQSTRSTFPPQTDVWCLPCTHIHTHAAHLAHVYAQPLYMAARRLPAAAPHAHPCTRVAPGLWDPGGLRLCSSHPVAAGEGTGAGAETGRAKGLSNHVTPAPSNAEGRYPPCPSSAPATSAAGSPALRGPGAMLRAGQACCPSWQSPRRESHGAGSGPAGLQAQGSSAGRKVQGCRAGGGGFLTAVAGAGNAAPHPLVRGTSLGAGGELGDRAADGWRQESRARGLDGVKIWGAESKLPRAGGGRRSGGPVGMPVLLGRGVGRAPGGCRLPVVRVVVNPRHMVVAGEVRVLRRPRHVILGVEVEAGMPDGAGIHVGVLIQKITYIHLPRAAPRTCRVGFGGDQPPLLRRRSPGRLGELCPGARHLPARGLLLGPTSRSICIERQVCISKCRNPSGARGANSSLPPRLLGGRGGG